VYVCYVICCINRQETTQLQKRLRLNQACSENAADGAPANCVDDEWFQKFVSSAR